MANFNPSVAETRETVPRSNGDYRFANFERIPSLPASGPAYKSKQHAKKYFNNKQIFRTICEWFDTWMPWQRRIILCGTTDRCSTSQLEYLATALEPVFHRDFQTSLKGYYPALTSKKVVHTSGEWEKTVKLSNSDVNSLLSKQPGSDGPSLHDVELLSSFASTLIKDVITEAVKIVKENGAQISNKVPPSDAQIGKLKTESKRKPSPIVEVLEDSSKDAIAMSPTPSDEQSTGSSSSGFIPQVPKSDRTSLTRQSIASSQKAGFLQIERRSIDTSSISNQRQKTPTHPLASSFSLKPSERRKAKAMSHAYNQYFYGQEETSFVDNSRLGESQLGALPPLESKKVSTFNWCLNHRVTPSTASSPAGSAGSPSSRQHRHSKTKPVPGSAASTADFFDRAKIEKLGPMKGVLRTGQIKKPAHVEDLSVSFQKSFKPSKWWTPRPVVVTAKKHQLRAVFKEQVEQIWVWLKELEDHEKGDLLVELIKMCDQELVRFFASCLTKRLEDRMDINSLPDGVLLRVFSLLAPGDLLEVEQVCRRWHYLACQEELWRLQCRQLGLRHNCPDLVQLIEFYMCENAVDWREAYWQLSVIMAQNRIQTPLASPHKKDLKGMWRMLTERIAQLRERYHEQQDTVSESSVSTVVSETESERSEVVELEIAVAVPRPSSAHTDTSSMDERDQPDSREDLSATPPLIRERRRRKSSPVRRKSTKIQEIALDIRPEISRARDLLNPSSEDQGHIHYNGKIKQIKRVRRLQGHSDTICCARFDIRRLVTGSMDRTIRVWDIRSGKGIRKLTGHKGGVRCLQFDETRIVSGSWDMSVMVWDVVRFELLAELSGHMGVVACLQFNDRIIVSASHDRTIRVWSLANYECERIIRHHSDAVTCLILEGDTIISGSFDRTIKLTSVSSGECLQTMQHELQDRITTIQCVGDQLLAGTLTGRLLIWNREDGGLVGAYQALDSPMYKLALISDDRDTKILTASADGAVYEWVLDSMICVRVLQGHRGPVRDIQVSDARVVSCSEDKTVRIWDLSPPPLKPGNEEDAIDTEIVNERDSD